MCLWLTNLTGAIRQFSSKDIADRDREQEPLLKNSNELEMVTELLQELRNSKREQWFKIEKSKENNDDQKEQQGQQQQRADICRELLKLKSLTDKARRAVRLRAKVSIEFIVGFLCVQNMWHTLSHL